MEFKYKIRDQGGHISSGTGSAANRRAMIKELRARGFSPIAVMPSQQDKNESGKNAVKMVLPWAGAKAQRKGPSFWQTSIGKPVKDEELLLFTRDLYSLVHAGVPLVSGLRDLASEIKNRLFKDAIEKIGDDLNAGSRLSEGLKRHPDIFDAFYANSVEAGEQSGELESILQRLIHHLDHDIETRLLVVNAIRYPIIVLSFLGVAFGLIVTVVIPKIAQIYSRFETELPLPTRILIAVGNFCHSHGLTVLGMFGCLLFAFHLFKKTPQGKWIWDGIKLRLPVFGALIKKLCLSKFASTLQTLYGSGIVLPEALSLSSKVSGNDVIARAIEEASEVMRGGVSLSEALRRNRLFPPMVIRIIMMGEKTGNLEDMLGEIVHYYDREIQYMTKSLGTLIEPILTVCLGLMILVLALGVFLPMWNVIRLFRH